jgi:acyl-coenzyme A synthetase/AMP-(fatty) acid ligase
MEAILNEHRAVYKSAVVEEDEDGADRLVAYVALEDGYAGSRDLGRELMDYIVGGIERYNSLSRYMWPEWVSFADRQELPRTSKGEIDHRKLQKMVKNWSRVFPGAPASNPFEQVE